jgi:hypothetical protein
MKKLDIPYIFKSEANDLIKTRETAIKIHGTADIKAAGNEIEMEVRSFLKRMLPKSLYVTQGHLIDRNGFVSPQLDVIIAEKTSLPSLLTTKDGTEYIPLDSVYAIGEIKSTYYKNKKYEKRFCEVVTQIKTEMAYQEIPNTAYHGVLNDDTIMRDMYLGSTNRTLNKLYSFMIYIDGGDFNPDEIAEHYQSTPLRYLPNLTVLLDKGAICYANLSKNGLKTARYPDEEDGSEFNWLFYHLNGGSETGSPEGNHLGLLYYNLLLHITNSFLEPPNLTQYMSSMFVGRLSTSKWLGKSET